MSNEMSLNNKLFVVGSTRTKGVLRPDWDLTTTELMCNYGSKYGEYPLDRILVPLNEKDVMEAAIRLSKKIVTDMDIDEDDNEYFAFLIDKFPLIQISSLWLTSYYTDLHSAFIDNISKMDYSSFMDREKFDNIIAKAVDNLEKIFIWHVDFDSPMTLDMYLKYFTSEMDTDEEGVFDIYIYQVYDINPNAITLLPWYDINKCEV